MDFRLPGLSKQNSTELRYQAATPSNCFTEVSTRSDFNSLAPSCRLQRVHPIGFQRPCAFGQTAVGPSDWGSSDLHLRADCSGSIRFGDIEKGCAMKSSFRLSSPPRGPDLLTKSDPPSRKTRGHTGVAPPKSPLSPSLSGRREVWDRLGKIALSTASFGWSMRMVGGRLVRMEIESTIPDRRKSAHSR